MAEFTRRSFVERTLAAVSLGAGMMAAQKPGPRGVPVRPLGKTGVSISIVGYGGWDCVVGKSEDEAIKMMHEAADQGITFFDNCWEYHNGKSEEVMGKALAAPGYRDKVFLMTKICARDYDGAKRHLDDSLRRLKTDRIDLLQFHAIQYEADAKTILDPEKGGMRAVQEARKAGKVRFVGFSGHMDPNSHLEMIRTGFDWDSVQMPLNIMDAHFNSFQKAVVPVCMERKIGVLGMKSLAGQDARIPRDLHVNWELCRRYALSLPVSTVICGMQTRDELRGMLRVARDFKPLSEQEMNDLLDVSRGPAQDGHIEEYKNRKGGYGCSYQDKILKG